MDTEALRYVEEPKRKIIESDYYIINQMMLYILDGLKIIHVYGDRISSKEQEIDQFIKNYKNDQNKYFLEVKKFCEEYLLRNEPDDHKRSAQNKQGPYNEIDQYLSLILNIFKILITHKFYSEEKHTKQSYLKKLSETILEYAKSDTTNISDQQLIHDDKNISKITLHL